MEPPFIVTITNTYGEQVFSKQFNAVEGLTAFSLENFASGLYVFQLNASDAEMKVKLIVE